MSEVGLYATLTEVTAGTSLVDTESNSFVSDSDETLGVYEQGVSKLICELTPVEET